LKFRGNIRLKVLKIIFKHLQVVEIKSCLAAGAVERCADYSGDKGSPETI
jgi:hypothetical protein